MMIAEWVPFHSLLVFVEYLLLIIRHQFFFFYYSSFINTCCSLFIIDISCLSSIIYILAGGVPGGRADDDRGVGAFRG